MATYTELRDLFGDGDLQKKIQVAVVEAARLVLKSEDTGTPFDQTAGAHDDRLVWAARALSNTTRTAENVWKFVLAENKGATVVQIQDASDTAIQTNVNGAVDGLAQAIKNEAALGSGA